jgi:hypothetical protein
MLAAVAVLCLAVPAGAVTFNFSAPCTAHCDGTGESAYAYVTFDETFDFVPGGQISRPELFDWYFEYGDFVLTKHNAAASGFTGRWGATPDEIPFFSLGGSDTIGGNGKIVGFLWQQAIHDPTQGNFAVSLFDGSCLNKFCTQAQTFGAGMQFESNLAPVPLPAALPLLLGGVAALGALRWRRRR